jgi:hypothetical protein
MSWRYSLRRPRPTRLLLAFEISARPGFPDGTDVVFCQIFMANSLIRARQGGMLSGVIGSTLNASSSGVEVAFAPSRPGVIGGSPTTPPKGPRDLSNERALQSQAREMGRHAWRHLLVRLMGIAVVDQQFFGERHAGTLHGDAAFTWLAAVSGLIGAAGVRRDVARIFT